MASICCFSVCHSRTDCSCGTGRIFLPTHNQMQICNGVDFLNVTFRADLHLVKDSKSDAQTLQITIYIFVVSFYSLVSYQVVQWDLRTVSVESLLSQLAPVYQTRLLVAVLHYRILEQMPRLATSQVTRAALAFTCIIRYHNCCMFLYIV